MLLNHFFQKNHKSLKLNFNPENKNKNSQNSKLKDYLIRNTLSKYAICKQQFNNDLENNKINTKNIDRDFLLSYNAYTCHKRNSSNITELINSNTIEHDSNFNTKEMKLSANLWINSKRRQSRSSQKKIIREVFSFPIRIKRSKQQTMHKNGSNCSSSYNATKFIDNQNDQFTNAIEHNSYLNIRNRNLNSAIDNLVMSSSSKDSLSSRKVSQPYFSQYWNKDQNDWKLIYITPHKFNIQSKMNQKGENVFKIPSQRVISSNTKL